MKTVITTFAAVLLTAVVFAQKINPIVGAFSVKHPTCNTYSDGEVSILPAGGLAPYSYIWSTGDTTQTISNLPAGVYSVSVTDALGQSLMGMATLQDPAAILIGGVVTNTPANTSAGVIDITNINGAVGEYAWMWSSNNDQVFVQSNLDQTNLKTGIYKIAVTDENGCQGSAMFQVNSFIKPIINNTINSSTSSTSSNLTLIENNNTPGINQMEKKIEIYNEVPSGNIIVKSESEFNSVKIANAITGETVYHSSETCTLLSIDKLAPGTYMILATGTGVLEFKTLRIF